MKYHGVPIHRMSFLHSAPLLAGYLIFGGITFNILESGRENDQRKETFVMAEEFKKLNKNCLVEADVMPIIKKAIAALQIGIPVEENMSRIIKKNDWDYLNSVFFSTSLLTTVGYGNITPATSWGRVFCMFYIFLGVPITGLFLHNITAKLLLALQKIWSLYGLNLLQFPLVFRIILFLFPGFILLLVCPAIVFSAVEGWYFMDGFYYSVVTLSTVGFGDHVAGNKTDLEFKGSYQLFLILWMFIGVSFWSFATDVITNLYISSTIDEIPSLTPDSYISPKYIVSEDQPVEMRFRKKIVMDV